MKQTLIRLLCLTVWILVPTPSGAQTPSDVLAHLDRALFTLSENVRPAVVQILVTGYASRPGQNSALTTKQHSTGSGVILDPDGYIVTNAHVVNGARRVQVLLPLSRTERKTQQSILKTEGQVVGAQILKWTWKPTWPC